MQSAPVPDFPELLRSATRSALHLEMRDAYGVAEEAEEVGHFLRTGRPWTGERAEANWKPWLDLVGEIVARGVVVRRARIVSEPVTDYIRFEHAITAWNLRAGEDVRWLPRRRAVDLALPGADFWLIDGRAVRFNLFSGDGAVVDPTYSEDPAVTKLCADAFDAVWERATPHADYTV
ncbi:DUF6879 family protein [Streptomyces sp. NPDC008238]